MKKLLALITSLSLLVTVAGTAVAKSPTHPGANAAFQSDNLPHPLAEKQAALKAQAQAMVLNGEATPKGDNKVVKVAKGQYVQLAFSGEDQILTVLGEFGDQIHPVTGGTPGPVHNQIPAPDRSVDNTTIWRQDFSRESYEQLLFDRNGFPSMANFYLEQSSGQYTVDGYVSDWVQVPYNEARYGTDLCGSIVCSTVWSFVNTSADEWWDQLVAEKGSVAAANAFLATFDVWDRYDADGDGNVNEPDGYIDHFQSVHAGQGEETGGGAQGDDAIWSHRWYAYYPGSAPSADGSGPNGYQGVRIGNSNYWIGDYTIEPENGGVGVFSHEFAHDLGLPDEYDTSGNTGGAENSTAWWTIMSQGSYGTQTDDLGSAPIHFNAWDKFQLGFLNNYNVVRAGQRATVQMGPAEYNTKKPQATFVILPNKEVTKNVGTPFEGSSFYYSGAANDLDTTMVKSFDLPANASLTAKVRYSIESDYDIAYVTVDGELVPTSLSNSSVNPDGIDGHSTGWVDLTVDLSSFTGAHDIGFGYLTDGGVQGDGDGSQAGIAIDNIAITGQPVDGAESDAGWAFDSNSDTQGFHVTTGSETFQYTNYYVLENRQYIGYDKGLKTGPYNFGFPEAPNLVEHFPYQDGLLVWYWDNSFIDNNVGDHPGGGLILPVDAHPAINHWTNGQQMRPRLNSYDSTFTTTATDSITVHDPASGVAATIPSHGANPVFDDSKSYWVASDPSDAANNGRYQASWNSVKVPNTGTVVRVKSISSTGMMVLDINK